MPEAYGYTGGTITITAGSAAISAAGAAWLSGVLPGDTLVQGNTIVGWIDAITSNTAATLRKVAAASYTGTDYIILHTSSQRHDVSRLSERYARWHRDTPYLISTTGAPDNAVGSDGWIAIDRAAGIVYVKMAGAWGGATSYRLRPRGSYGAGTAYIVGDVVTHQSASWLCLTATTGNPPPTLPTETNTYWMLVAKSGDLTTAGLGAALMFLALPVNDNLLVNGDFVVNERGFAGGALSAGVYGHDRWKAAAGGADYTVAGTRVVTLNSGELEQVVEGAVFDGSFGNRVVTLSVDNPSADMTATVGSQSGTIAAGSGRRSVTLTLTGADSFNVSVKIKRSAAGAVTFSRAKLEYGATVTAWRPRLDTVERGICARYYRRLRAYAAGSRVLGRFIDHRLPLVPAMRASPTLVTSSPAWSAASPGAGNALAFYNYTGGAFATISGALTLANAVASADGVVLRITAATSFSGNPGDSGYFEIGTGATIALEAEL